MLSDKHKEMQLVCVGALTRAAAVFGYLIGMVTFAMNQALNLETSFNH